MESPVTDMARMKPGIPGSTAHQVRTGSARAWTSRFGLALFAAMLGLVSWPGAHSASCAAFPGEERSAHAYSVFGPAGLLLHHAPSSESLTSPVCGAPSPTAKDRASGFAAIMRAADRTVRSASALTARTAKGTLVALRRCALLFPFHFFW